MAIEPRRHRFDVEDYYRMVGAGILSPHDRVELLEGEIVDMAPIGPCHAGKVTRGEDLLHRQFGDVAMVRVQNPIRIDRYNEPEPDLALVHWRPDFYESAHPTPSDVHLVVEVSDTTLAEDRAQKIPSYGRAGIPETWHVDIPHDAVHVYRDSCPDGYRVVQTFRRGDKLAPLAFPDRELDVSDLLG